MKEIQLIYIQTEIMHADILTKNVNSAVLNRHRPRFLRACGDSKPRFCKNELEPDCSASIASEMNRASSNSPSECVGVRERQMNHTDTSGVMESEADAGPDDYDSQAPDG